MPPGGYDADMSAVPLPGTALTRGTIVPGVAFDDLARDREVRAWDFRGRTPLVLAFLHPACDPCAAYARDLAAAGPQIEEAGGRVFAVLPEASSMAIPELVDREGRGVRGMLGPSGEVPTLVVTDRYAAAWESYPSVGHDFPPAGEIVDTVWHLATMCEECGIIAWE